MPCFIRRAWLGALLAAGLTLVGCSDGSDAPFEAFDDCNLRSSDIDIAASTTGIEFVRTPDACFDMLAGYPFAPNYALVDGMRMHYVDEGPEDGEVILMLHGQPSWSYLYRKMIPLLADAGYRVIAADHIGMGRSDKPVDPRVHVYDQQVAWNTAFIQALGLTDVTLFVQDWGSLIGLRVAGENPALFARIVIANGDLPPITAALNPFTVPVFEIDPATPDTFDFFLGRTGNRSDQFQQWIDFAASAPQLFAADVVQLGSLTELSEQELAAYNAPFPGEIYRGSIRAFPSMVAGIIGQQLPALEALGAYDRPFLALAGESDPGLGSVATQNGWINRVPGAQGQPHARYDAGHFIQEDAGPAMAALLDDFMQANPIPNNGPLYNRRYCEVLLVNLTPDGVQARVFNSLGLNNCPQAQWDALDGPLLAAEFGALAAGLNGPRFWVLDLITQIDAQGNPSLEPPSSVIESFGGIEMFEAAVVTIAVADSSSTEAQPYTINEVQRSTIFTYAPGRRVYELHDPDGAVYIMQSMSRIVDEDLQLSDLATLGERLDLPAGWRFTTRILPQRFQLTANGLARVITDDLSNTYQRIE